MVGRDDISQFMCFHILPYKFAACAYNQQWWIDEGREVLNFNWDLDQLFHSPVLPGFPKSKKKGALLHKDIDIKPRRKKLTWDLNETILYHVCWIQYLVFFWDVRKFQLNKPWCYMPIRLDSQRLQFLSPLNN